MLRKLLKHELIATGKILLPIYGITLILALVNRILINIDIYAGVFDIIRGFIMLAYGLSIAATLIVTYVIIILRFYKNLMSEEGYLMFTLPVKPAQLINSKLIASILWTIVSVIIVCSSLLILLGNPDRIENLKLLLSSVITPLKLAYRNQYGLLIAELIILIFASLIQQILLIYVSIAIGHLFSGHRVLGSFASYIAINTIMQAIVTFILFIWVYLSGSTFETLEAVPQIVFPFSIIVSLVFSTLYYLTANYIFNRKLNLE